MTAATRTRVRRDAASLLTLLCLVLPLTAVMGTGGAAAGADDPRASASGTTASKGIEVDRRLNQGECRLTGRVWVPGQGCARHRCVPGATMFKEGHDAELCQMRGRHGAEYARPINSRRCKELKRVWVGEINSCASNPNRARTVAPDHPACRGAASTYVNHREEEGAFDECLTPGRVAKLRRVARRQGISLNKAALDRSRFNCEYRAGTVMRNGVCVKRQGPPPASDLGGTYIVGDSVAWRADNELAGLRPRWHVDLRPGRRLDELAGRLDWFRADHGHPDALILQLGTNRRKGFHEHDFREVMATVPASTPVLFVLPYRKFTGDNAGPVNATKKHQRWMRNLAADRPNTCLADWPTYAANNLDNLVDGGHPDAKHERWFARYIARSWDRCRTSLGG